MGIIETLLSWLSVEAVSLVIIAWCITRQSIGKDGFYVAHIIFFVYLVNVWIGSTEIGMRIEENNFHYLQTLYCLIVISLLRVRKNRLSICMIGLYTGYIFVHMIGHWLEVYELYSLYYYTTLLLFGIEVALLLSERITNGFYRILSSVGFFRLSSDDIDKNSNSVQG